MKYLSLSIITLFIYYHSAFAIADECDSKTISTLDLPSFHLNIAYINVNSVPYRASFDYIGVVNGNHAWKLASADQTQALETNCPAKTSFANNVVSLAQINTNSSNVFSASLDLVLFSGEYYLSLLNYAQINNGTNQAPVASSLSQQVDPTLLYQEINLIATDADGDTLNYELLSASSGSNYSNAYINPLTPKLYVTLNGALTNALEFQYRVTDGQLFSQPASVSLNSAAVIEEKGRGLQDIAPETYANYNFSSPNGTLFGAPAAAASLPSSIDLSSNFPIPGNQGTQSSCVGWATAYALKSYQEKVEMNWSLNTTDHLFSPGFIYNQINQGQDQGSLPQDALNLAVNSGVATWASMPYVLSDPFSQPSQAAKDEAAKFKAASWAALRSTQDMKATLANQNPILLGIQTYPQISLLNGQNSVFNDYSGQAQGGHAITIVGYDDNKFGGAFKIINSWGTDWGDNGYFWLPYDSSVILQAYSLVDADNTGTTTVIPDSDTTEPQPTGALPNLTVSDWNLNYDARPGGQGQLTYKVSNTGDATAPAGSYISLILSRDNQINSNDIFVVYEQIPIDLEPGQFVFRDQNSLINFQFSTDIQPGDYFLALWVDNTNTLIENNESDNISLATTTINFANSLPDLNIESWFAQPLDQAGNVGLIYTIRNDGVSEAPSGWDINLVLSNDPFIGNGDEIYLVYETIPFNLPPGQTAFRDASFPLVFNLFQDINGQAVPNGNYYLAFWVDDQQVVAESNEDNNFSFNDSLVPINSFARTSKQPFNKAYNGTVLLTKLSLEKAQIRKKADGTDSTMPIAKKKTTLIQLPKKISAFDKSIFPLTTGYKMPN